MIKKIVSIAALATLVACGPAIIPVNVMMESAQWCASNGGLKSLSAKWDAKNTYTVTAYCANKTEIQKQVNFEYD